jgi:hypothetical protein
MRVPGQLLSRIATTDSTGWGASQTLLPAFSTTVNSRGLPIFYAVALNGGSNTAGALNIITVNIDGVQQGTQSRQFQYVGNGIQTYNLSDVVRLAPGPHKFDVLASTGAGGANAGTIITTFVIIELSG